MHANGDGVGSRRETVKKYEGLCSVCGGKSLARGYCDAHYQRWRKYGDPLGGGAMQPRTRTLADRLNDLCDRSGGESACWNWIGCKGRQGYGNIRVDNKTMLSHRARWQDEHGEIPGGMVVCHTCDNPSCCNPRHLWLGTQQENVADMIEKGRFPTPVGRKGESSHLAKLAPSDIAGILAMRAAGIPRKEVAAQVGVSPSHVWRIETGKAWRHITVDRDMTTTDLCPATRLAKTGRQ